MLMNYHAVSRPQSEFGQIGREAFSKSQYSKQEPSLYIRRTKKNSCYQEDKKNSISVNYEKLDIKSKLQSTWVPSVNQNSTKYATKKKNTDCLDGTLKNPFSIKCAQNSAGNSSISAVCTHQNENFHIQINDQEKQEPFDVYSQMIQGSPAPKTPASFFLSSSAKNELKSCATTPSTTASGTLPQKLKSMKLQFYRTKMCPWVITSGHCRKDANCRYAHFVEELRPLPDLSKTKMCEDLIKTGSCKQAATCNYAHCLDELRATQSFNKTKLCPVWIEQGYCLAGKSCRFAHGEIELRSHQMADIGSVVKQTSSLSRSPPATPQKHPSQPPWPHFSTGNEASQWSGGENVCSAQFLHHQVSPIGLRMANGLVYVQSHVTQKSSSVAEKQIFDSKWQGDAAASQEEIYNGTPGGDTSQVLTHLLPSGIFTPITSRQATNVGGTAFTGRNKINNGSWSKPNPLGDIQSSPPIYYAATVYTQPTLLSATHFHTNPTSNQLIFPATSTPPQEGTPMRTQNVLLPSVNPVVNGNGGYQTSPNSSPVSLVTTPAGNWAGQFLQLPVLQTPLTTSKQSTTFTPFPTHSDPVVAWGKSGNLIPSPVAATSQTTLTVDEKSTDIVQDSNHQTDISPSVFSFKSDRYTSLSHEES